MTIITPPTGDIGHQVLQRVLQGSEPVRVIVRDPSRIPVELQHRLEVVSGSHGDAATIGKGLIGAKSLFWLIPPEPLMKLDNVDEAYADFTKPAAEAIKRCGVERVVAISAIGRGWNKDAGLATANIKADDLLASTGAALRVLAMPSFMDNMLRQAQSIRETGTFSSPVRADLKAPVVATADIAAVAARFLLDSSWSGQADVPVLGPEDLTQADMAAILSDVLGKPVHFEQTPMDAYKGKMARRVSEAFAQGLADMMTAKNEGMDNTASREIAADTPTTFRQWCETTLRTAILANASLGPQVAGSRP